MTNQVPLYNTQMVNVSASIPVETAEKLNDLALKRKQETGRFWSNAALIREILADYFTTETGK